MRNVFKDIAIQIQDIVEDADTAALAYERLNNHHSEFRYFSNRIASGFSGQVLDMYLAEIQDTVPGTENLDLNVPTQLLTSQDNPNHPKLSKLRYERLQEVGDRRVRVCYCLALLLHFWDFQDDTISIHDPKSLQRLNDIKLLKQSLPLVQGNKAEAIHSMIDDIVRVGQVTDSEYSLDILLSQDSDDIADMVLNNFRHTHTNYDYIESLVDISELSDQAWKDTGRGLRRFAEEVFYTYFTRGEVLRIVESLQYEMS